MRPSHDMVVIGAGSAGLVAARTAAALGARVLLVESERVGGDCTWTGCIPSKALIHAAAARDGQALARARAASAAVYARETPEVLARAGIEVLSGEARFRGPRTVLAAGREVTARRWVIATGAAPRVPSIPGLQESGYLTHRTVFNLDRVPPRLAVIGGGGVGLELAQSFGRLGSLVTLFEAADRLLPGADADAGQVLLAVLAEEGVDVRLGAPVENVRRTAAGVEVTAGGRSAVVDHVLLAAGRRPFTEGLDLERAGIRLEDGAVAVDVRLRTTAAGTWAAGDVTGGPQFTHHAGWQGYVAARNALLPRSVRGIRAGVPAVVFTDPAVGQVGLTTDAARERHRGAREDRIELDHVDRAQAEGRTPGFVKLVSDGGGRLLGASIVSPHAGELINEVALALRVGARVRDLARAPHVYPTYGFALQDMAVAAGLRGTLSGLTGRAIRGLVRARLR